MRPAISLSHPIYSCSIPVWPRLQRSRNIRSIALRPSALRIAVFTRTATAVQTRSMSEIVKNMSHKPKKTPAIPRPSSSVLLISPTNQILLLHRVKTSTSFASAHVFPGGNVSAFHDGTVPDPDHDERHVDSLPYRMAAVRETFEESGILLAKDKTTGNLLSVDETEREMGRKLIHDGKMSFPKWLEEKGGIPDTEGLLPFTRWITPPMVPKRYTTQMYLYFLPLSIPTDNKESKKSIGDLPIESETVIHVPTHDGGVEHTAARFLAPADWIKQAQGAQIVLYPPQFFLLSMVAQFLKPTRDTSSTQLEQQRRDLQQFVSGGDPPWKDVCISPIMSGGPLKDGRSMLTLNFPGKEVEKQGRRGVADLVVLLGRGKGGNPNNLEIKKKQEVADLVDRKQSNL